MQDRKIEILDIGTFRVLDYTFKYETSTSATFGEGQDFYFHKFKTSHKKYGEDTFIVMTTTKMLTMRRLVESLLNWASITMYHDFAINLEEAGKDIMEVVVDDSLLHTDEWADAYREMPLASMVFDYAHNTFYVDCLAHIELAWQDFNAKHGNIQLTTIYTRNNK